MIPQQLREFLKLREQHDEITRKIDSLQDDRENLEYSMGEARSEMAEANRTLLAIWDGAK